MGSRAIIEAYLYEGEYIFRSNEGLHGVLFTHTLSARSNSFISNYTVHGVSTRTFLSFYFYTPPRLLFYSYVSVVPLLRTDAVQPYDGTKKNAGRTRVG
jgi:hypothetical protein